MLIVVGLKTSMSFQRQDNYELYMRVGQERRLIDVYRPDFMASLIGHFKFVAGMMVGEKRRSQLGS